MQFPKVRRSSRLGQFVVGLSLAAALSGCARQDPGTIAKAGGPPEKHAVPSGQEPPVVNGDVVASIDKRIFVVFQAKDNTYWFGSDGEGVYRWDGKAIVHFTTAHGLSGNRVRSIQEDRSGNILVGGDGGVSRFDGRTFQPLKVAEKSEWKLAADDLWFTGWQDEGVVYRYDGTSLHRLAFPKTKPGEDHIAKHPRDKFPGMVYSPYDVYIIFKDSKEHLWFGTVTLGVCRYDGANFAWAPKTELGFGEDDSFGLRSIAEDKDGRFWFSNTLHRFDVEHDQGAPAGQGTGDLRVRKQPGVARAKDLPEVFMSSVKDKNGDLWLATLRSGVWRYDGARMTQYPVKDGDVIVSVYSIYRDRQDVLWLGTHEHGVYKFNGASFEKVRF